jgi:hypothetical protein
LKRAKFLHSAFKKFIAFIFNFLNFQKKMKV